jgi:hypothetical protein
MLSISSPRDFPPVGLLIGIAIVIVSQTLWALSLWPGAVTQDSLIAILQAKTGAYTQAFPLLNIWLAKLLVVPLGTIGPYIVLQAALCCWTLVYCLRRLWLVGTPIWVLLVVSIGL